MNNASIIFAFVVGAAVGSVVTWKLVKTKYEQIAQEEIDSVKETFSKRMQEKENDKSEYDSEQSKKKEAAEAAKTKANISDYADKLTNYGYGYDKEKGGVDDMNDSIQVISPDEFGDADGYSVVSLTYYEGDGVLTDDWDNPIPDVEGTVGSDFASHFGEFEQDSVFIRNNDLRTEFEILRDLRSYSDLKESDDD